ncbi:Adenosine deaminase [hydrothermal vent metagenome]|uniref:Adenosine deaminase n=1 Tax=hydrothermal vent metagenome TaxID=652676 RepID=A0A3B0SKB6_9ZZZZ
METFLRGLPKAELHLHIEGTLEPEMMFDLAQRNDVTLPYANVAEIRAAYEFENLQSFLDVYYAGASVLVTASDFSALMSAYLDRAIADGVRHAEIFFDPQTHTERGIAIETVFTGFAAAQDRYTDRISTSLILCFLRHLPPESAVSTLRAALAWRDRFIAVGLDSGEAGNPPELFVDAYREAKAAGLRLVAHAGEEGPADYVRSALDILHVERIDHGVRAADDPNLVARLVAEGIPLTMCPLSNQKLQVFPDLRDHNLKQLLDQGVRVTINSDDPSYFGGYILDNYLAIADALNLGRDDLILLARNSIEATFLADDAKAVLLAEIDDYVS